MKAIDEINSLVKKAANEAQTVSGAAGDVAAARERERQRRLSNGKRMRDRIERGVNPYNPGDLWHMAKSIAGEVAEAAPNGIPYAAARLNQSFSNVASEAVPSVVGLFSHEKADKVRDFIDKTPLGAFSRWTENGVKELEPGYLDDTSWDETGKDSRSALERGDELAAWGEVALSTAAFGKAVKPVEAAIGKATRLAKYIPVVRKVLPAAVKWGGRWFTSGAHEISGMISRAKDNARIMQQNAEELSNAQPVGGNADFWPSGAPRRQGEVSDPYATAHQQMPLQSYGK